MSKVKLLPHNQLTFEYILELLRYDTGRFSQGTELHRGSRVALVQRKEVPKVRNVSKNIRGIQLSHE